MGTFLLIELSPEHAVALQQKGCRVRGSRGGVALHCSMITARLRGLQVAQNAKHPGQQLFHPFFRVQGERARTTLQVSQEGFWFWWLQTELLCL